MFIDHALAAGLPPSPIALIPSYVVQRLFEHGHRLVIDVALRGRSREAHARHAAAARGRR